MTDPTPSRRDELIAAALADDLSSAEQAELDALRAADPTVDVELAELAALTTRLGDLGDPSHGRGGAGWVDLEPSDDLRHRIAGIAASEPESVRGTESESVRGAAPGPPRASSSPAVAPVTPLSASPGRAARGRRGPGRRALVTALGAAACLAVGAGAGALVAAPRDPHVDGPPGTLGAVEPVAFAGAPSGVAVDGDVVAHTWGTETLLTVTGLPAGDAFTVVVVGDDGREYESGTFLGTDVEIDCSLNAAVLREDVAAVEIRGADGADIAVAEVPGVGA
ncbi:hypothetical protein ASF17_12895 [Frigoribacterium sp. Leaf263]|uniref:hypothetical protein n=1 Tax=Frigoribacterium sp. Leaf263 TaxID=1736313 RepID=UPI0006F9EA0D|nr:hypothetical protein [Frigoribacterium sp. Leaf263]KQO81970.1 hypothetical protein ASF17_12895 [Frigoribacterium sp. Leaf263]